MSYVDQGMSKGRIWAIVLVFALHALLGYAFVTGLAYKYVKSIQEDLKTFDVMDEPPPPPEEPPPPEQKQVQPPPVVTPPPLVRTNVPPPPAPITSVPVAPPPVITPTAPPAPPAPPPPPRIVQPVAPRANLASLVSNDDYPSSAIRNNEQGTTGFRLAVGENGRVTDCTITSSSGSSTLDNATCRLMRSRARFTPARDNQGNATSGTHDARIRWVLPD